jgi:hypothetical protein
MPGYTGDYTYNGQRQHIVNGVNQTSPPAAGATGQQQFPTGTQGQSAFGNMTQGQAGPGSTAGSVQLAPWSGWAQNGGVNPQGWMSLGGSAPGTGYLGMGNWTQGGADPTHVQGTNAQDMSSSMQPYVDQAYQQATRTLDPQWAQSSAAFDQQMVNQGLQPGSAAYNTAKQQFDQSKNDAYSQAHGNAMTQGLQAQAQGFGQGLSQSQLANQLSQSLIGANSQYTGQQLQGNQAIMQALLNGNSGIAQQIIGGNAQMGAAASNAAASRGNSMNSYNLGMANLGENARQFDQTFGQSSSQQDFGNLMQLLGMGQGVNSYNNGLIGQDQSRNQSFFGMGNPGGSQGSIDVQNPYNNYYNGQLNQNNYANNQANANNQNMANYASLFASFFGG